MLKHKFLLNFRPRKLLEFGYWFGYWHPVRRRWFGGKIFNRNVC